MDDTWDTRCEVHAVRLFQRQQTPPTVFFFCQRSQVCANGFSDENVPISAERGEDDERRPLTYVTERRQ